MIQYIQLLVTGQPTLNGMISNQNLFSPCVAFRVVGTPVKHINSKWDLFAFFIVFNVQSIEISQELS